MHPFRFFSLHIHMVYKVHPLFLKHGWSVQCVNILHAELAKQYVILNSTMFHCYLHKTIQVSSPAPNDDNVTVLLITQTLWGQMKTSVSPLACHSGMKTRGHMRWPPWW